MKAADFVEQVKKGGVDVVEHTHKVIDECKKINKEYHYFNAISDKLAIELAEAVKKKPKGKLAGLPVSVKDCICVKGVESRAGSAMLAGYKPVFDATVVERVKKEGGIIIGKTAQDEFGFGSWSLNVGKGMGVPRNPIDKERTCGGSSGGSGGITKKASFPHISLGESTGGSITCPASFCGVHGLCPTYGRVSRYGLIDYANSLDKIGPMATSVADIALMQQVISGHDPLEPTSLDRPVDDYLSLLAKGRKGLKVGVVKETFGEGVSSEVADKVKDYLSALDIEHAEVSLPLNMKYSMGTYYLIATSEASTNLAKLCGMRYGAHKELKGSFNDYFSKVRGTNFGAEAKRRIIIGTYARMAGFRDDYYIRATKVRTLLINEYKKALKKHDILLTPTMPVLPPRLDEVEKLTPLDNYMMDILTIGANLAGLPHLNVPVGTKKGLPVGATFIADHLQEGKLIQVSAE
jgi:aspartyl-tRNA(Asn)/glutamyl-tRNA(Gln) amidotransferase subunit A